MSGYSLVVECSDDMVEVTELTLALLLKREVVGDSGSSS